MAERHAPCFVRKLFLVLAAGAVGNGLNHVGELGGVKLVDREFEILEQRARIIVARAFFFRQADVVCGHQELDIPLQLDDAELSECAVQSAAGIADNQFVFKAFADVLRELAGTVAGAVVLELAAKQNGIDALKNADRQIGALRVLTILAAVAIVRAEDAGASFASEQDGTLVIGSQAADRLGTTNAAGYVAGHAIEKFDVNGVKAFVERDGFDIKIRPKQFGTAGFDADGGVQQRLRAASQVNTQTLKTFFVTTVLTL